MFHKVSCKLTMKPYMISELLRLGAIKLVYFTPLLEDSKCRRVTNAFQFLVHVVDLGKHILVLRILHASEGITDLHWQA